MERKNLDSYSRKRMLCQAWIAGMYQNCDIEFYWPIMPLAHRIMKIRKFLIFYAEQRSHNKKGNDLWMF